MTETAPLPHQGDIRLFGEITDASLHDFLDEYSELGDKQRITVEIMTPGGDPDIARRIALEIQYAQDRDGKDIFVLGKTTVYSAGIIILSAVPRQKRFLSKDCILLIHERRVDKEVKFSGPMRTSLEIAEDLVKQFEMGQLIERRDYDALAAGCSMSSEEIFERAKGNWYCTAEEALKHGLVEGIVQ